MDVRPGGRFALTSVDPRGNRMSQTAVYREVVEPERLVIDEPAEDNWHGGAVTTVALADLGDGRTRMDFHAAKPPRRRWPRRPRAASRARSTAWPST